MEFLYVNPIYVTNLNFQNSMFTFSKIKKVVYIKKRTKKPRKILSRAVYINKPRFLIYNIKMF